MLSGGGVMERRETRWVGVTHGQVPRMPPGLNQGDTQHKEGSPGYKRERANLSNRQANRHTTPPNTGQCSKMHATAIGRDIVLEDVI